VRVVGLAAAARLSVQPACQPLERAPAGPTVLGLLAAPLHDLAGRAGPVHALLARLLPPGLGNRGRHVARAWIALPSHGPVAAPQHDEVCRSHAKGGTTPFFP
jgi:hypothetical protein